MIIFARCSVGALATSLPVGFCRTTVQPPASQARRGLDLMMATWARAALSAHPGSFLVTTHRTLRIDRRCFPQPNLARSRLFQVDHLCLG